MNSFQISQSHVRFIRCLTPYGFLQTSLLIVSKSFLSSDTTLVRYTPIDGMHRIPTALRLRQWNGLINSTERKIQRNQRASLVNGKNCALHVYWRKDPSRRQTCAAVMLQLIARNNRLRFRFRFGSRIRRALYCCVRERNDKLPDLTINRRRKVCDNATTLMQF